MVPHYTLYSTQYCEILNSEVGMVWIDTPDGMGWEVGPQSNSIGSRRELVGHENSALTNGLILISCFCSRLLPSYLPP